MEPVEIFLAAGLMVAGLGYLIGSFRRGKNSNRNDSLSIAIQEIELMKAKVARLEIEVAELRSERTKLELENQTLRGLVLGEEAAERIIGRIVIELQKYIKTNP